MVNPTNKGGIIGTVKKRRRRRISREPILLFTSRGYQKLHEEGRGELARVGDTRCCSAERVVGVHNLCPTRV